jgi:hypothetical protein
MVLDGSITQEAARTLDARSLDPNTEEGGRELNDESLGAKHRAAPREWLNSAVSAADESSVQLNECLSKEEVR